MYSTSEKKLSCAIKRKTTIAKKNKDLAERNSLRLITDLVEIAD
jgi:hypothetical protein